jgi:hypothetical protein
LTQATNDRATAIEVGRMQAEAAGSHVDPAAMGLQTSWRQLVRARGALGLSAGTRAFRGAAGAVLSAIGRSGYGRSAIRSRLVGGPR